MALHLSSRISIQVGEKSCLTTRETISESRLLTALLSTGGCETFVDGDPSLFEHVLRYLRTGVFPLFFSNSTGHDHHMYLVLLRQAQFYKIDKLEDWLTNERYLNTIVKSVSLHAASCSGPNQLAAFMQWRERTEKCRMCPQNNWEHLGRQTECLRAGCYSQRTTAANEIDTKVYDVEVAVKTVQIVEDISFSRSQEPAPPPYHSP